MTQMAPLFFAASWTLLLMKEHGTCLWNAVKIGMSLILCKHRICKDKRASRP